MKNPMRRLFGILTQVGFALLATVAMYVCSYVIQIGELYDNEMPLTLAIPPVMILPAILIYWIWFSSKARKFTDGTYIDQRPSNYARPLFLIITIVVQYLLGFVMTLPLFGVNMEVSMPLLISLACCEVLLVIANVLCFWVFYPISNEKH